MLLQTGREEGLETRPTVLVQERGGHCRARGGVRFVESRPDSNISVCATDRAMQYVRCTRIDVRGEIRDVFEARISW